MKGNISQVELVHIKGLNHPTPSGSSSSPEKDANGLSKSNNLLTYGSYIMDGNSKHLNGVDKTTDD